MDRESVPEEEEIARGDAVLDAVLPDLAVELVGYQHHDHLALAGGVGGLHDAQAVSFGLGHARGLGPQADEHRNAGVLQIQGVGMALRAVADDGHGLAFELLEVCIVVVEHDARGYNALAGSDDPR